jgi:hypothetical protein
MRRSMIVALATAVTASGAAAQRTTTSVDVGGASIRYGDSVSTSVMSLTPAFHARWDRATLSAAGSYASLANSAWSVDGSVDASLYSRSVRGFVGEVSASGGGATRSADASTGRWAGLTRAHYMTDAFGAYAGAGVGGANDGRAWRAVRQAEAGLWGRVAGWTLLASWSPETVDDTIYFADSRVAARWEGARVETGLSGGARSGSRFVRTGGSGRSWASASLVVRLTRYAAVVGSAGTYPVDLAEGFPGGRFASAGVRFATPRAPSDRRSSAVSAPRRDGGTPRTVTAFQVEPAGAGRWTFRVQAPDVRGVEVNGDFSGWMPVTLVAGTDGWWTTTLAIPPGRYQTNVRVDSGRWLAPPGLVAVRDEFGGVYGVLTVR